MKARTKSDQSATARAIIECRLSRWAAFERRELDNGNGYPKKSNFAQRQARSEHVWTPADEAEAWETGNAIQHLDHMHQMVIRAKWIAEGTMTAKYAALRVSQQNFSQFYREAVDKLVKLLG